MQALADYRTLVFDCDGVILNSNRIKTEAFYQTALPYGEEAAASLVSYHVANGGVSRYRKFEYFLSRIVGTSDQLQLDELLACYAALVREGLLNCEIAAGIEALRAATPDSTWLVVSGGDQAELREVFSLRGLQSYFDGGIFGSPDDKRTILARELQNGNIKLPGVLLGDSRLDFSCAMEGNLDFVFVSEWSEFFGWREFFDQQQVAVDVVAQIQSLVQVPA